MMCETQRKMIPDKDKLKHSWLELGLLIENKNFENFTLNQWGKFNKIFM